MILAIDTSAGQCAVALVGDGTREVLSERMDRGHVEALMPMIARVTGGDYSRISRIAVCTGPGSFTGLRVGISAARGLALGLSVPCIGVGRLEALAPDFSGHVALRGRGETIFLQRFEAGQAAGEPFLGTELPQGSLKGDAAPGASGEDGLVDLLLLAEIAGTRDPAGPPAPLYLRDAAADPPREAPPRMLD